MAGTLKAREKGGKYCRISWFSAVRFTAFVFTVLAVTVGDTDCAGSYPMAVPAEGESRDYCQLETFYAACSGGGEAGDQLRVVSMLSARYGRMRLDGRCVKRDYGYIGCAADVLGHVDRLCSGRRVCDFPVAELHGNQPCPNDLTPYLEAAYECLPVVTEPSQRCGADMAAATGGAAGAKTPISVRHRTSGYLASSVTMETGRGGPNCPWHIEVPAGQVINITLINFARVGLPSDWMLPGSSSNGGGGGNTYVHSGPAMAARPKVCYQLADIRESVSGGETVRTLTECEGGARLSHAYTSSSSAVFIEVIVAKILNVHFLLHFKAVGCVNTVAPAGTWLRRVGDELTVRCNATGEVWQQRCVGSDWRGHTHVNCSTATSQAAAAGMDATGGVASGWDVGHVFGGEAFPLSILLVVAVGVAMGVFVGGVLLVCAARYVRRRREAAVEDDEDYSLTTHHRRQQQQQQQQLVPPGSNAYLQLTQTGGKTTVLLPPEGNSPGCSPVDATSTSAAPPGVAAAVPTAVQPPADFDVQLFPPPTGSGLECSYCVGLYDYGRTLTRHGGLGGQSLLPGGGGGAAAVPAGVEGEEGTSGQNGLNRTGSTCGRCGHRHRMHIYGPGMSSLSSRQTGGVDTCGGVGTLQR